MKFVVINPKARTIETVDAKELHDAERGAGLNPDSVDHGVLAPGLAYVVYEFGHFVPAAEQSYFSINRTLISGAAVLYGIDEAGETIDIMKSGIPDVRFYLGANDVEAAIERNEIRRPQMAVNGQQIWAWPNPAPREFQR